MMRPRPLPLLAWLLLILGVAAVLPPAQAEAHVRNTTGFSVVTQRGSEVRWQLGVDYDAFARAAAFGLAALQAADDETRAAQLAARLPAAQDYLTERMAVRADGVDCPLTVEHSGIGHEGGRPYAELDLLFACHSSEVGSYQLGYEVFRATDGIVDDHDNIVQFSLGGASGRTVFDRQTAVFESGHRSWSSQVRQFVLLGFHHILAGADHVLFVLALVLGARRARDLVWAATAFTLAHSVTIALAALGWVNLPASVVEPLIALSIAFVAVDGVLAPPRQRQARNRLVAVFCFGLLHGLGFAGALQLDGGSPSEFLASLVSFNAGIELGQLLVIGLTLPCLLLARRCLNWRAALLIAVGSLVIGALGSLWFVERVLAYRAA